MVIPQGSFALTLTPLREACVRRDLMFIHEVLVNLGYKDDEGSAKEVCL